MCMYSVQCMWVLADSTCVLYLCMIVHKYPNVVSICNGTVMD